MGKLAGRDLRVVLLFGVVADRLHPDARAVRADLAPLADPRGVEPHGDDHIRATTSCLFYHAGHRLVPTLREKPGELGDLAAADRAESGDASGADVAGTNGQPEDLTLHGDDVVSREFECGCDEHAERY